MCISNLAQDKYKYTFTVDFQVFTHCLSITTRNFISTFFCSLNFIRSYFPLFTTCISYFITPTCKTWGLFSFTLAQISSSCRVHVDVTASCPDDPFTGLVELTLSSVVPDVTTSIVGKLLYTLTLVLGRRIPFPIWYCLKASTYIVLMKLEIV